MDELVELSSAAKRILNLTRERDHLQAALNSRVAHDDLSSAFIAESVAAREQADLRLGASRALVQRLSNRIGQLRRARRREAERRQALRSVLLEIVADANPSPITERLERALEADRLYLADRAKVIFPSGVDEVDYALTHHTG